MSEKDYYFLKGIEGYKAILIGKTSESLSDCFKEITEDLITKKTKTGLILLDYFSYTGSILNQFYAINWDAKEKKLITNSFQRVKPSGKIITYIKKMIKAEILKKQGG